MGSYIKFPDRSNHQPPAKPERAKRGIKRVGDKTAKLKRETNPERAARKESVGCCMICRKPLPPDELDGDEIARGYARQECLKHPELTLISCRRCHDRTQNEPPAKRIMYIILWEIDQRCKLYCELRGTAETHVTAEDVIAYLMFRKRPKRRISNGKKANQRERPQAAVVEEISGA